jgi:hypothetical protein
MQDKWDMTREQILAERSALKIEYGDLFDRSPRYCFDTIR